MKFKLSLKLEADRDRAPVRTETGIFKPDSLREASSVFAERLATGQKPSADAAIRQLGRIDPELVRDFIRAIR